MKLLDKFILRITQGTDEAWQDGYRTASEEADETVEAKDDFIARQGEIIVQLMDVLSRAEAWEHVPSDLFEELRNYA